MRDRYRAARLEEKLSHRTPDDIGAADDNRIHAFERTDLVREQYHAAHWRAGNDSVIVPVAVACQKTGVHGVTPVDIICRVNRAQNPGLVDMGRQRPLDQYAVDAFIDRKSTRLK